MPVYRSRNAAMEHRYSASGTVTEFFSDRWAFSGRRSDRCSNSRFLTRFARYGFFSFPVLVLPRTFLNTSFCLRSLNQVSARPSALQQLWHNVFSRCLLLVYRERARAAAKTMVRDVQYRELNANTWGNNVCVDVQHRLGNAGL